jgi:hypothetical protein
MSKQQNIRVQQAIRETERLLAKELAYSVQHQNAARIAEYRTHIAKLNGMVA